MNAVEKHIIHRHIYFYFEAWVLYWTALRVMSRPLCFFGFHKWEKHYAGPWLACSRCLKSGKVAR